MQPMVFHPINSTTQQQVTNAENTYGQALGNLQNTQQDVQNYQKNMVGGQQMMAQETQAGNQWAGYDPASLKQAQAAAAATQGAMAALPQAVQAQGGGYGITAGAMANNQAQMAGNLNTQLGQQVATVGQQQANQQAALGYAQAGTQAGQQTQQMSLQALQGVMVNAQNQYATAQADKQNLETLFQQQGQFNADEAQKYQAANASMLQAQAQMKAAQGSYAQAMAQAAYTGLQSQGLQNNLNQYAQQQAQQAQLNQARQLVNTKGSPSPYSLSYLAGK